MVVKIKKIVNLMDFWVVDLLCVYHDKKTGKLFNQKLKVVII